MNKTLPVLLFVLALALVAVSTVHSSTLTPATTPEGAVQSLLNHVKAHERICVALSYLRDDTLIIVDRVDRRNRRIIPPVIHNQLPAASLEWLQIRVGRVQGARSFLLCGLQPSSSVKVL